MQYRVPNNIDQEDKILGPLTFVQLIYVLIGGALLLIIFATLPFVLFLILGLPITVITIAFALIKVQDQPFSRFFLALLVYLKQPKHRIWKDMDNAPGSDGLGLDFHEDLLRDNPTLGKAAIPAASTTTTATVTPAIATTAAPTSSSTEQPKKILAIQHDQTATTIATNSAPTGQAAQPDVFDQLVGEVAAPVKPARTLTVQVVKGGA